MQVMVGRERLYTLEGSVLIDGAYLGGGMTGGKAGRGTESIVPFIAAVALNPEGKPLYAGMDPIDSFSRREIADWAGSRLSQGCMMSSDGLACSAGAADAGCLYNRNY